MSESSFDIQREVKIETHSSLYYPDGDIVILSLPKDDVVLAFKVDKIYLSRNSPVFAGMLSLPSPEDLEEYDSVPLVRLQDEADHLIPFLNAIYDPMAVPSKDDVFNDVVTVHRVLKLATKYQCEKLRKCIVGTLESVWPLSLVAWDANEKRANNELGGNALARGLPEPCSTIILARDCHVPQILPAAFYHLSRVLPFARQENNDGDGTESNSSSSSPRALYTHLSRRDLVCCTQGFQIMPRQLLKLTRAAGLPGSMCPSPSYFQCPSSAHSSRVTWDKEHIDTLRIRDILKDLLGVSLPQELCSKCQSTFSQKLPQIRENLWEDLPMIFGLDSDEV